MNELSNHPVPALSAGSALEKFKMITTPMQSRATLRKVFFNCNRQVLCQEDYEEVYFLLELLDGIE